ncbi:MAG TPA: tripartite tricarboxylate transporter substrate binding protein [Candidatus Sulfotelmatobacter sp.]|nr:tripartite tricarboxylate transporter substrate binding protein [Candidatus Sulfotelmatobacter sp.]
MRRLLFGLAACWGAALAVAATSAAADDYPNRPVHVIVGFAPGGTTDITARLIAQSLTELWGQQIVVENRPGAATVIASEVVAQSPPDGYTLFQNSNSHVAAGLIHLHLNYDPIKSFTPISKVLFTPNIILVNNNVKAHTLPELIALARANPGKLSYGNPGIGTITHLGGELFKQMAHIDIVPVAYRGGALSIQALISGELPMTFNTVPEIMAQVQAGTVRPIAVTTAKRAMALPDVPTIGETLPGYDVEIWQAWLGPAGMPAPIVAKINAGLAKVLTSPQIQQRFADLGAQAIGSTPDELGATMRSELARWTQVVQVAGIKPQ